jgi:hypothetical protein
MKHPKKPGSLAFTVDVDSTEYRLNLNGQVVGHYNTLEGLLNGVRERAIKSKTKSGSDLDVFIHTVLGLQTELKELIRTLAFTTEKKMAKGPSKTALAEHTRERMPKDVAP